MSDLRDDLSAAMASVEAPSEPAGDSTPVETSSVETTSEPVSANADTEAVGNTDSEKTPAERSRDMKGRFAPKTPGNASKLTETGQRTPVVAGGEVPPAASNASSQPKEVENPLEPAADKEAEFKAPPTFTPAEREALAAASPEIKKAIQRREYEMRQFVNETQSLRQFDQAFQKTVSPYIGMIQAEGGDPLHAVGSMLQTAAALRTAPPAHKAKLVANICRTFGVPIDALDAELAGQPIANTNQPIDAASIAQQVRQEVMQSIQQQRERANVDRARQDVEAFKANAEFFDDVREDVADLIELATRRKRALSLEDAYSQACKMHPEISKVLSQRDEAKRATANQASTQRSRAAASSVKSQPASVSNGKELNSVRDYLEASMNALAGR